MTYWNDDYQTAQSFMLESDAQLYADEQKYRELEYLEQLLESQHLEHTEGPENQYAEPTWLPKRLRKKASEKVQGIKPFLLYQDDQGTRLLAKFWPDQLVVQHTDGKYKQCLTEEDFKDVYKSYKNIGFLSLRTSTSKS